MHIRYVSHFVYFARRSECLRGVSIEQSRLHRHGDPDIYVLQ